VIVEHEPEHETLAAGFRQLAQTGEIIPANGSRRFAPDPKRMPILECSAHAQFIFATPQGPPLLREVLLYGSSPH
jgi:hypothetical protein